MANGFIPDKSGFVPDNEDLQGKRDSAENLLQKAIQSQNKNKFGLGNLLEAGQRGTIAGPTGIGSTPEIEETFGTLGQTAGSVAGTVAGARFAGAPLRGGAIGGTVGRGIGESGTQAVNALKGEGFDPLKVGRSTGEAALIETLFLPVGGFFQALPSGEFGKALRAIPGNPIGRMKDRIIKEGRQLDLDEFLFPILDDAKKLFRNKGVDRTLRANVRREMNELVKIAEGKGGFLDPIDVANFRKSLDIALKKSGFFNAEKIPKDVAEGQLVRNLRQKSQDVFTKLAGEISPKLKKDFVNANKAFSRLAKKFPPGGKGAGKLLADITRAGGLFGGLRGDVGTLASGVTAAELLESKAVPALFASALQAGQNIAPAGLTTLLEAIQGQSRAS